MSVLPIKYSILRIIALHEHLLWTVERRDEKSPEEHVRSVDWLLGAGRRLQGDWVRTGGHRRPHTERQVLRGSPLCWVPGGPEPKFAGAGGEERGAGRAGEVAS